MWHKALKNRIGKKRGRTLTIMAISTGDESVKSLSIPILWMYAGLALIIGVSVFLASSYLGMSAKVARFYVEHVNKDSYIAQLSTFAYSNISICMDVPIKGTCLLYTSRCV